MRQSGTMTESPPKALRADALRNHQRIVAAAREAIEEFGAAAQVEDIARRAGVAMATVYRRFAGRDDLVRAVFDQFFAAEVEPIVAAATTEHDARHGLVHALEDTIATLVANEALLLAARDAGALTPDVVARYLRPLGPVLRRAQEDGVVRPDLEPADLPVLVSMVVTTVSTASNPFPVPGPRTGWRRYFAVLLDGVRPGAGALPLPDADPSPD